MVTDEILKYEIFKPSKLYSILVKTCIMHYSKIYFLKTTKKIPRLFIHIFDVFSHCRRYVMLSELVNGNTIHIYIREA